MTEEKISRREKIARAKRRKQMQSLGVIIIGLLIIVSAFVLISLSGQRVQPGPEHAYQNVAGNTMGNPDAPVTLTEYYSFACSHCRNFAEGAFYDIIQTYVDSGLVYYVSHTFNDPASPYGGNAALAVYCAADQEKYWEMHDTIFANFSSTGYTTREVESMAKAIDLNLNLFNSCLNDPATSAAVIADLDQGLEAGVTGTPNFLINGVIVVAGNAPFETFQAEIDAALAAAAE